MVREKLPNRRPLETVKFQHGNFSYFASIGYEVHTGAVREVFLQTGKSGTELEAMARDAAILISLALQSGALLDDMRNAITRLDNGEAAGPVGRLLDLLNEAPNDA